MITIFKKLFGKSEPKAKGPVSSSAHQEPSAPIPTVEVAHLSLATIVARLPEELQAYVRQAPDAAATVALPIPTIIKQLPSGAVKMSFASLHRQAPAGVFSPLPPGDKRMVNVPLSEIFRHVSPRVLKRRNEQRAYTLADDGLNLFGNSANPYEIAPNEPGAAASVLDLSNEVPAPSRPLRMTSSTPTAEANPVREPAPPVTSRGIAPPPEYFEPKPVARAITPPTAAAPAPRPAPKSDLPPLRLPVAPLASAWPDEIRGALAALNGSASVQLPADDVVAGLAKGKVIFTWGQIRSWIEPALDASGVASEETPLTLPLKVVAPAFLAASKQGKPVAKKVDVNADIPALFTDGRAPVPAPVEIPAEPEPVVEVAPVVEDAPIAEMVPEPVEEAPLTLVAEPEAEVPSAVEEQPAPTLEPVLEVVAPPTAETVVEMEAVPVPVEEPLVIAEPTPVAEPESEAEPAPLFVLASEPAPAPETVNDHPPAPVAENVPAALPAVGSDKLPESVGEAFGEPDKQQWTPGEIVSRLTRLPGISGAAVALQEGLLVAHSLPEGVKGEVVAAFLPQIFARLNQYAGEMKLGDVDDILFTTHGAHCQIYRLGAVYFAVLGKPGESLPWHELRLVTEELAKQTQPS